MYEVAKGTPVIGHGIAAGHAFAGRVKLRPFDVLVHDITTEFRPSATFKQSK